MQSEKQATGPEEMHCIDCSYSGGPGEPYYQPYFLCSCGWSVRDTTWESVGASLDAHLGSVK